MTIAAGVLVLFVSRSAQADPQTVQGSIVLGGTVNGPPPDTAPTITSPTQNSRFSDSIVQVKGDCTQKLFIELYRNNSFAGQVLCSSSGTYEINVSLTPNENTLLARIKDGANQYGPNSSNVIVFYDVPVSAQPVAGSQPTSSAPAPFLLNIDNAPAGVLVGRTFKLAFEMNGGRAPYAVSTDWGDDSPATVTSVNEEGDLVVEHTYDESGQFTITISASDNRGQKAVIQTIAIIAGARAIPEISATACAYDTTCIVSNRVVDIVNRYLWPSLIVAFLMTASFWLGEKIVFSQVLR